jgi:hypothetical protein
MTNEELEREISHLATREQLAELKAELLKWMIGLQLPTWLGIIGILIAVLLNK